MAMYEAFSQFLQAESSPRVHWADLHRKEDNIISLLKMVRMLVRMRLPTELASTKHRMEKICQMWSEGSLCPPYPLHCWKEGKPGIGFLYRAELIERPADIDWCNAKCSWNSWRLSLYQVRGIIWVTDVYACLTGEYESQCRRTIKLPYSSRLGYICDRGKRHDEENGTKNVLLNHLEVKENFKFYNAAPVMHVLLGVRCNTLATKRSPWRSETAKRQEVNTLSKLAAACFVSDKRTGHMKTDSREYFMIVCRTEDTLPWVCLEKHKYLINPENWRFTWQRLWRWERMRYRSTECCLDKDVSNILTLAGNVTMPCSITCWEYQEWLRRKMELDLFMAHTLEGKGGWSAVMRMGLMGVRSQK